ncbi:MAG: hypothetical protein OEU90_14665 [Gammaproteobacteria bacterium]|jgi:hypothetical protein|nr:hypothetical protein [Gammaproteobacteria bacterium]MDH3751541.1 hypothetical protein [Gammaproteobacteria bacterium]MDH3806697.1 hypothetical protein [Gammaproteobacteria bacterium]
MTKRILSAVVFAVFILVGAGVQAQQFEAVYSLENVSSSEAKAAMADLYTV